MVQQVNDPDPRPPWLWGPGWRRPVRADEPGAKGLREEATYQCRAGDPTWTPIGDYSPDGYDAALLLRILDFTDYEWLYDPEPEAP